MNTRQSEALEHDKRDDLARFRQEFHLPDRRNDRDCIYLCGNSLGLQPRALRQEMLEELQQWQALGVLGHTEGRYPWLPYHENLRAPLAELTGALPSEVVAMNTLTVNLHLMMVSFYRPTTERYRIIIEKHAFPSDRYAVESQIRYHGFDPDDALIELEDSPGSACVSLSTLESCLSEIGDSVALILMPGVQYYSGQVLDMSGCCELARQHGCSIGFDLAHAIGNIPMSLHEWGADFAVWCSYKYLNSGPGAVAGCFVHQRHEESDLPRFNGWWGHVQSTRFLMGPEFHPAIGADAWQLSNPPIMALAPVRVSMLLFMEAGMTALREKSIRMTGFLSTLLDEEFSELITILTPSETASRGCQLSLQLNAGPERAKRIFDHLEHNNVICDWREPNVIRVAPTPLYNSFTDCVNFTQRLREAISHVG